MVTVADFMIIGLIMCIVYGKIYSIFDGSFLAITQKGGINGKIS